MKRVRILVVDDQMAPSIMAMFRTRFGPRWLRTPIAEFVSFERWSLDQDEPPCDIAVFDVRNEDDQEMGHFHAVGYARVNPKSLVIVKSVHDLTGNVQRALRQLPNIRLATGTEWDALLLDHVMTWLRGASVADSLRARFQLRDCAIAPEARARFASASAMIDVSWLERAEHAEHRAHQLALLEILGKQLHEEAKLASIDDGAAPYLRIKVDKGAPWMPWEYLLFGKRLQLSTPLLYWMEVASPPRRTRWNLGRILFVHQATTQSWREELEAIERQALAPLGLERQRFSVEECDLEAFIAGGGSNVDVLHFAMHGPDTPATPIDEDARARLLEAIRRVAPRLVILNACNGIYFLLKPHGQRYPISVDPLETLFEDGVDTVVTTHFPLQDREMPPIWSRTFYLALALTGDVAVAAAWARSEVALQISSLSELATVVVSRQNSCLTSTGISPLPLH